MGRTESRLAVHVRHLVAEVNLQVVEPQVGRGAVLLDLVDRVVVAADAGFRRETLFEMIERALRKNQEGLKDLLLAVGVKLHITLDIERTDHGFLQFTMLRDRDDP